MIHLKRITLITVLISALMATTGCSAKAVKYEEKREQILAGEELKKKVEIPESTTIGAGKVVVIFRNKDNSYVLRIFAKKDNKYTNAYSSQEYTEIKKAKIASTGEVAFAALNKDIWKMIELDAAHKVKSERQMEQIYSYDYVGSQLLTIGMDKGEVKARLVEKEIASAISIDSLVVKGGYYAMRSSYKGGDMKILTNIPLKNQVTDRMTFVSQAHITADGKLAYIYRKENNGMSYLFKDGKVEKVLHKLGEVGNVVRIKNSIWYTGSPAGLPVWIIYKDKEPAMTVDGGIPKLITNGKSTLYYTVQYPDSAKLYKVGNQKKILMNAVQLAGLVADQYGTPWAKSKQNNGLWTIEGLNSRFSNYVWVDDLEISAEGEVEYVGVDSDSNVWIGRAEKIE